MNRRGRILLVDDDRDCLEALSALLRLEGYQPTVAHNGQEALQRIAADGPPCVIVLDWLMPVMSGAQFLEQRRRDPVLAATLVVIVTGTAALVPLHQVVLQKPVDCGLLLRHIKFACGSRAS